MLILSTNLRCIERGHVANFKGKGLGYRDFTPHLGSWGECEVGA